MPARSFRAAVTVLAVFLFSAAVTPVLADPPPWAPAHGWRDKHGGGGKHHKNKNRDIEIVERPVFIEPRGSVISCDRSLLSGNKTLISQILGGAAGGLAGAQFGQGTGKLAATAGGALIGFLIGNEVGQSLDAADAACAQQALEDADTGQTVTWRNPDQASTYQVTPTRTYQSGNNYCREYTSSAEIGGRTEQTLGIACRQPDGSWEIQG